MYIFYKNNLCAVKRFTRTGLQNKQVWLCKFLFILELLTQKFMAMKHLTWIIDLFFFYFIFFNYVVFYIGEKIYYVILSHKLLKMGAVQLGSQLHIKTLCSSNISLEGLDTTEKVFVKMVIILKRLLVNNSHRCTRKVSKVYCTVFEVCHIFCTEKGSER